MTPNPVREICAPTQGLVVVTDSSQVTFRMFIRQSILGEPNLLNISIDYSAVISRTFF